MKPTVDNVLNVYRNATPEQVRAGTNWYLDAHKLAIRLDPVNLVRAAGVIAAFSPRMKWERNIMLAERLFETGVATGSTGRFNEWAQRIYDGADPATILAQKTTNFYRNILDPWNQHPVTIDVHAIEIALGTRLPEKQRPKLTSKRYEEFSDVYRAAALMFNLLPSTMQAITWVTWKENKGVMAT